MDKLIKQFNSIDLYPVLCKELSLGRSNEEVLREIILGGAKIVQYRDKVLSKQDFLCEAKVLWDIAKNAGILFIINDYVDIAKEIDADGVHLGQDDIGVLEAREILGKDKIIGVSTHNIEEAKKAEADGASYINVGPIFSTKTKKNVCEPIGIKMFKKIKKQVTIPVTVMGGINKKNIKKLVSVGADKIAVVSAVVSEKDIAGAVRGLIEII